MSSAPTTNLTATAPRADDPDQYRMTIGEHLEELRRRFVFGLMGFAAVAVFCFIYGKAMVSYFCQPLVKALDGVSVSPQIYMNDPSHGFTVFMQISLICAAAISGPWMIYQVWLFVGAGLYPHERKYITRYVPLSIGLFVGGMVFVYYLVLPWTLSFFLAFATDIPLYPQGIKTAPQVVTTQPLAKVPSFDGDPTTAVEGDMWYDKTQRRLKFMMGGIPRVLPFGPSNLIAPQITLPNYIDLVVGMLVVFALAFQLPLVVLALLNIGILELETAKSARKYVYFVMVIISAIITPGDVITATVALLIPLCLLYELGIILYVMAGRRKPVEAP